MADAESRRKCFKCSCSFAQDNVKLFRFPKPAKRNLVRCELWAQFIFPEKDYSSIALQTKLHTEHRMLCQKHFKDEDFTDASKQKLVRAAVPSNLESEMENYDCQTDGVTSTPSELNEAHFDITAEISHSFDSLEETNMSNLLSPMETVDYDLNEIVEETAPVTTLFCICCLKREVPLISLVNCSHAEFLNNLIMPKIEPKNQVTCHECHEKLKKIKLFKLQVEESFKLFSAISTDNTPKCSNQRHNLEICKVLDIDIPQININNIDNPETILEYTIQLDALKKVEKENFDNKEKSIPPKSLENKSMKNIEEAIRIINNNQNSDCISFLANSLQSISHSLLGELVGQNSTEILVNVNAPTATVNPTDNVTNIELNEPLNVIENTENIDAEESNRIVSENVDTVENEEMDQAVSEEESVDVDKSNDVLTEQTLVPYILDKRPSLGSNIKQLTLTKEQLMDERSKIAASLSFLRAPHRCESCLIGFQFQENIEDHNKRKHACHKRNTYQCDVCLQFVENGSRNIHTFWHYTRYECIACAERFTSYDKAALHYRKNHNRGKLRVFFKCPHCQYKACRKSWLAEHLQSYTECKLCGHMIGCGMGVTRKVHMKQCRGVAKKCINAEEK